MKKTKLLMIISVSLFIFSSVYFYADEADEFDNDVIAMGVKRGTKISKSKKKKRGLIQSRMQFRLFDQAREKTVRLANYSLVEKKDRFVIRLKNSRSVYVYVFNIDSQKRLSVIFPNKEIKKNNPLEADRVISLPPDNKGETLWYGFSRAKGKELFYTFMCAKPHPVLENLIKEIPTNGLALGNGKNHPIKKSLDQAYMKARKKSKVDKSNAETLLFKKESARKFTLILGRKKQPEKLFPIRGALVTLIQSKDVHTLYTSNNGILTISFPGTSSMANIITEYKGYILKGQIKLYGYTPNKPAQYRLYARQKGKKIKQSAHPFELYIKKIN